MSALVSCMIAHECPTECTMCRTLLFNKKCLARSSRQIITQPKLAVRQTSGQTRTQTSLVPVLGCLRPHLLRAAALDHLIILSGSDTETSCDFTTLGCHLRILCFAGVTLGVPAGRRVELPPARVGFTAMFPAKCTSVASSMPHGSSRVAGWA